MRKESFWLQVMLWGMITITTSVVFAISIRYTSLLPEPSGLQWKRYTHQLDETSITIKESEVVVDYQQKGKPYYRAHFSNQRMSSNAFCLAVDADQNGVYDFMVMDENRDGWLDFRYIMIFENYNESIRRVKEFFLGKLTLEKTI